MKTIMLGSILMKPWVLMEGASGEWGDGCCEDVDGIRSPMATDKDIHQYPPWPTVKMKYAATGDGIFVTDEMTALTGLLRVILLRKTITS